MAGGGGGGGGGDGGYAEEKAKEEARRKAARSRIARMFGIAGGVDRGPMPTREQFIRPDIQALMNAPQTDVNGNAIKGAASSVPAGHTVIDPRTGQPTTVPYTDAELYDMPAYQAALDSYNSTDADVEANRLAREGGYDRIRNDVSGYHRDRLAEDLDRAARQVRFALLGSGNYGGSGQVDRQTDLDRSYNRGIMDINNLAATTADQAEASDMSTYASLISQINAGMDEDSATTMAGQRIGTGVQNAIDQARGVSFGNAFDRLMGDLANQQYAVGASRVNRNPFQQRVSAATPGGGSYFGSSSS